MPPPLPAPQTASTSGGMSAQSSVTAGSGINVVLVGIAGGAAVFAILAVFLVVGSILGGKLRRLPAVIAPSFPPSSPAANPAINAPATDASVSPNSRPGEKTTRPSRQRWRRVCSSLFFIFIPSSSSREPPPDSHRQTLSIELSSVDLESGQQHPQPVQSLGGGGSDFELSGKQQEHGAVSIELASSPTPPTPPSLLPAHQTPPPQEPETQAETRAEAEAEVSQRLQSDESTDDVAGAPSSPSSPSSINNFDTGKAASSSTGNWRSLSPPTPTDDGIAVESPVEPHFPLYSNKDHAFNDVRSIDSGISVTTRESLAELRTSSGPSFSPSGDLSELPFQHSSPPVSPTDVSPNPQPVVTIVDFHTQGTFARNSPIDSIDPDDGSLESWGISDDDPGYYDLSYRSSSSSARPFPAHSFTEGTNNRTANAWDKISARSLPLEPAWSHYQSENLPVDLPAVAGTVPEVKALAPLVKPALSSPASTSRETYIRGSQPPRSNYPSVQSKLSRGWQVTKPTPRYNNVVASPVRLSPSEMILTTSDQAALEKPISASSGPITFVVASPLEKHQYPHHGKAAAMQQTKAGLVETIAAPVSMPVIPEMLSNQASAQAIFTPISRLSTDVFTLVVNDAAGFAVSPIPLADATSKGPVASSPAPRASTSSETSQSSAPLPPMLPAPKAPPHLRAPRRKRAPRVADSDTGWVILDSMREQQQEQRDLLTRSARMAEEQRLKVLKTSPKKPSPLRRIALQSEG